MIKAKNTLVGKLNVSIIKEYPELENVTITPTLEEQHVKSEKYGFDNVIVEGIPATDLRVEPRFEEQTKEGIFKQVKVGAIPQQILNITPIEQEQTKTGIFTQVNIDAIQTEEITPELNFRTTNNIDLTPQVGRYIKKVTINKPDSLSPENIKAGENVFGIVGNLADTSDGTATASDVVAGKIAYVGNQQVVGTMPDNGTLEFEPSDEEQLIPSGLTSGGIIKAINSEELVIAPSTEVQVKEGLFNKVTVGATIDTSDATATAEDVLKDKTFYANGEKIVGTMSANDNNAKLIQSSVYMFRPNIKLFIESVDFKGINIFTNSDEKNTKEMFYICSNLKSVKNLDTTNSKNMNDMFNGCGLLEYVNELNTEKVTDMQRMFASCPNLTDETLNTILAMCSKATSYTATKTLVHIGLTSDQATRCQSLSNYQAFLNAGWTTGY